MLIFLPMDRISSAAVFCASSTPEDGRLLEAASALGAFLANEGITLVYGGGSLGLMGAAARACRDAGGKVHGVLPEIFNRPDVRKDEVCTELEIVPDMHERKKRMYALAQAYIILPGGIGTLEEFFEIYTWKQIGYHSKNIILYNAGGFYTTLLSFLDEVARAGLMSEAVRRGLLVANTLDEVREALHTPQQALPDKIVHTR